MSAKLREEEGENRVMWGDFTAVASVLVVKNEKEKSRKPYNSLSKKPHSFLEVSVKQHRIFISFVLTPYPIFLNCTLFHTQWQRERKVSKKK
jgi:hypothetical protein